MSLTYVIPDIHGRHDLLEDGLARIAERSAGDVGVIRMIGDYVDRGPNSKAVIERLQAGVLPGWRGLALKGNHDAMMVEALRVPAIMPSWMEEGGDATLASYGGSPGSVPETHIAWLGALRLMHVDAHRVYVHAGVDPKIPLDSQREATLSATRRNFRRASVNSTSFMATTAFPTDHCCMKAAPTWTPRLGRQDD